jgi:hypothetical protein
MKPTTKFFLPRIILAVSAAAFVGIQWLVGEFPVWFFAMPMNLLVGALWLALIWEGYRRRSSYLFVQYLLSAEATYIALAVAAIISVILGLQSEPAAKSWWVVGGFLYVQTVLTLVLLRGWRNEKGVRWRFLVTHCGLWLAVTSMLLGGADKELLRVEVGDTPTREVVNERGKTNYLDYELRLENFELEKSEDGTPKQFRATVAVDEEIVDIEVNSPYSRGYGEDIYLVSYSPKGCVLQIVREPWRVATATGIAMLLFGAFMLFLQGFQRRER